MTVTNTTNTVQEQGNGVKTAYTFDFKVFAASDLEIAKVNRSTRVVTDLTITTDYTVSLNTTTEGGTVTYVVAPLSTENSSIRRINTIHQQTEVPTEGLIPGDTLNNEYDKQIMIDVQQQEELTRAIKMIVTSSLNNIDVPEGTSTSDRGGKIWAWNSAGTALELLAATIVDAISVIAVKGDIVQGDSSGDAAKLAIGSGTQILGITGGLLAWKGISNIIEYIELHGARSSGGDDGTFTAGAWEKRTVNAEIADLGSNVTIASSVITIQAGTYDCFIRCPAHKVDSHQAKLRNTSDSSDELIGSVALSAAADGMMTDSIIQGRFIITTQKNFEVQHICTTTRNTDGFGVGIASSVSNIFTTIVMKKVSD